MMYNLKKKAIIPDALVGNVRWVGTDSIGWDEEEATRETE